MRIRNWILDRLGRSPKTKDGHQRQRGPATHVVILDGTMSTLEPGRETSAGLTYKLLREVGHSANMSVYYEAGIQWRDWSETFGVIAGRGINRQIERAYGVLCSRWHPGDRIYLIGYSRGAFAVRSLAGAIDKMGLVKPSFATVRNIRQSYRYYTQGAKTYHAERFSELYCDRSVTIDAIGVWDTVKSLGLRLPLLWKLEEKRHEFHSDGLVPCVKSAFHALARDEKRDAFSPEVWITPKEWTGTIEQVWFRGGHGDVGGQLGNFQQARPLANISLVWLLSRMQDQGLDLPDGWQDRFPQDPNAPAVGAWHGFGKLFLVRHARVVGRDPSERIHETAVPQKENAPPVGGAPA